MKESLVTEQFIDYSGLLNFQIKRNLLTLLRENTKLLNDSDPGKKRSIYVLDELLTNAHNYYKSRNLPDENVLLRIDRTAEGLLNLSLTNTLITSDIEPLCMRIDQINSKSEDALRTSFHSVLANQNDAHAEKGMGLISIRLKTDCDFSYTRQELANGHLAFSICTSIRLANR
jgi:hypothetical protein